MNDKDKIATEQDESRAHGPKVDPNQCVKSPTGEHVWNCSPRPDNQRLGICRYCELNRILPGAMLPAKPLPPPPMPKLKPRVFDNSKLTQIAEIISRTSIEPKITITPAKRVTAIRNKPIYRTASEKLKILDEWRACKYGEKKIVQKKYSCSDGVIRYWITNEEKLRKKVGLSLVKVPYKPDGRTLAISKILRDPTATIKLDTGFTHGKEPKKQMPPTNVPYAKRLAIIDDFLSRKSGTRKEVAQKHGISKDKLDHWLRNKEFYQEVETRGLKTVRSEITKRSYVLQRLSAIGEATPKEAIKILKDWGLILFCDATRAQAEATKLFEQTNGIDLAILSIEENIKAQKQLQLEMARRIMEPMK